MINNDYYNSYPYRGYSPSYLSGAANSNICWVMGLESAKAYPTMPGRTILLMDSESPKFYIKTMDNNGYASIKTYNFQEEVAVEPASSTADYITREQLEAILAERLSNISPSATEKSKNLL